jgi:hypothetical protein
LLDVFKDEELPEKRIFVDKVLRTILQEKEVEKDEKDFAFAHRSGVDRFHSRPASGRSRRRDPHRVDLSSYRGHCLVGDKK